MIDEIIKLERLKTLESQILSVLHHMLLLLLKTADYWFQPVTIKCNVLLGTSIYFDRSTKY